MPSRHFPKSLISAVFLAVGIFFAPPVTAAEISFDCRRLDPRQSEELAARLRLALRPSAAPPSAILVACDETRAWVVWNGPPLELVHVHPDGNLVEAVLDAIESRVAAGPLSTPTAAAEQKPAAAAPKPSPNELPNLEPQPRQVIRRERPYEPIGGLGVGGVLEFPRESLTTLAGPRLDVALGLGAFWGGFEESARFGSTEQGDGVFLYDLELTLGVGAPFAPSYPAGIVLGSGVEWFSVKSTTFRTGILSLGLRGALSVDPIALSVGLDGRMRFVPPNTDSGDDRIRVAKFTALLSLSGVLRLEPLLRPSAQ